MKTLVQDCQPGVPCKMGLGGVLYRKQEVSEETGSFRGEGKLQGNLNQDLKHRIFRLA